MLTKLQAVNAMLAGIGESPVSTLDSAAPDAQIAIQVIDEVATEVLSVGWHVNTNRNVRLQPDANGFILIPDTYLRVEMDGRSASYDVAVRTDASDGLRKLWNLRLQTFAWTAPVYAEITEDIPYDDLTHGLKSYIKARAARVYQERVMGAGSIDQFAVRAEAEAYARLEDEEAEIEPTNLIWDNPALAYGRYRYGYRR